MLTNIRTTTEEQDKNREHLLHGIIHTAVHHNPIAKSIAKTEALATDFYHRVQDTATLERPSAQTIACATLGTAVKGSADFLLGNTVDVAAKAAGQIENIDKFLKGQSNSDRFISASAVSAATDKYSTFLANDAQRDCNDISDHYRRKFKQSSLPPKDLSIAANSLDVSSFAQIGIANPLRMTANAEQKLLDLVSLQQNCGKQIETTFKVNPGLYLSTFPTKQLPALQTSLQIIGDFLAPANRNSYIRTYNQIQKQPFESSAHQSFLTSLNQVTSAVNFCGDLFQGIPSLSNGLQETQSVVAMIQTGYSVGLAVLSPNPATIVTAAQNFMGLLGRHSAKKAVRQPNGTDLLSNIVKPILNSLSVIDEKVDHVSKQVGQVSKQVEHVSKQVEHVSMQVEHLSAQVTEVDRKAAYIMQQNAVTHYQNAVTHKMLDGLSAQISEVYRSLSEQWAQFELMVKREEQNQQAFQTVNLAALNNIQNAIMQQTGDIQSVAQQRFRELLSEAENLLRKPCKYKFNVAERIENVAGGLFGWIKPQGIAATDIYTGKTFLSKPTNHYKVINNLYPNGKDQAEGFLGFLYFFITKILKVQLGIDEANITYIFNDALWLAGINKILDMLTQFPQLDQYDDDLSEWILLANHQINIHKSLFNEEFTKVVFNRIANVVKQIKSII